MQQIDLAESHLANRTIRLDIRLDFPIVVWLGGAGYCENNRKRENEKEAKMSSLALTARRNRIMLLATLHQNPPKRRTRISQDRLRAIRASHDNFE